MKEKIQSITALMIIIILLLIHLIIRQNQIEKKIYEEKESQNTIIKEIDNLFHDSINKTK